jgi:hypothetical protein
VPKLVAKLHQSAAAISDQLGYHNYPFGQR